MGWFFDRFYEGTDVPKQEKPCRCVSCRMDDPPAPEAHGIPTDASARKAIPMFSGCLAYFPHALAAVAQLSRIGNDQHNPGQPLHWAKDKSKDELDCLIRHAADAAIDPMHRDADGVLAAVKMAWRALANLERMHDAGRDIFAEKTG